MTKKQDQRRTNLVDPKLQYKIMGVMIGAGALVAVIFLIGLYLFISRMFGTLEGTDALTPEMKNNLFHDWNRNLFLMIELVGGTLLGLWLWAFYFTNKIAGPIYRMNKQLANIIQVNPAPVLCSGKKDRFYKIL